MSRLTLTGFLRVLRFFPVALNPSYIHLLYHNDKSAKPDRTFKRSCALSDVGKHWAEKCFHSVFCIVVCCSRVIARPSHVSNWIFSLKLNVFTRIIWTTRDGEQRITDLPLIELTTKLLSLPGREPLIFLQRNSITTEWTAEGNERERLCRILIMYKIEGNKCSLILLASYTSVVMYW